MKKNYIAPETSVLEVEVANMMALSVGIGEGGDVHAPRHNDWDIWGNNHVVELDD